MIVMYETVLVDTAFTTQADLHEIVAPATHSVYIHEIHLSQLTEVGDAMDEELLIQLKTGSTTSGSGGNSVTALPIGLGITAFGGTCETANTTKASTGTIVTHRAWHWKVLGSFDRIFAPELYPRIAPSERCTLELATTPADSITIGGYIVFGIK